MTPQILQSLISINRNSIREYEELVVGYKFMRDDAHLLDCPKDAYECHKLMLAHKKHLALLVRNQVGLKKALRDAYTDEHYWKTVGGLVHEVCCADYIGA